MSHAKREKFSVYVEVFAPSLCGKERGMLPFQQSDAQRARVIAPPGVQLVFDSTDLLLELRNQAIELPIAELPESCSDIHTR
ncbi:MAG: hypothetical protein IPP13_28490 [Kouleothrix sp.]|nr:hypothetical protein [Kouleothrix sp.]